MNHRTRLSIGLFAFLAALPLHSQDSASNANVRFHSLPAGDIEARLDRVVRKNEGRQMILSAMFKEAGCAGERLQEQPVRRQKTPNVICVLPGSSNGVVIVGAHFDRTGPGLGVVDNWSGAALLPSLVESLSREPRRHTFIFVGFTEEERGLIGSKFYAKQMTREQVAATKAMINLDSLGLGPTKVWLSRSDDRLAAALFAIAKAMKLPLQAINADQVGDEDSRYFRERKIPTVVLHSITQDTLPVLHSSSDKKAAVKVADYVNTYRLVAAYLAYLDTALDADAPQRQ